jgi:hypothetical protein
LICGLFADAVSSSACIASDDRLSMNNELEKTWRKRKKHLWHSLIFKLLCGGAEENDEKFMSLFLA